MVDLVDGVISTLSYFQKDFALVSSTADDLAIRTLFERWYRAIQDGNIAALRSLVTADMIVKAPGSPPILGARALEKALTAFLEGHLRQWTTR